MKNFRHLCAAVVLTLALTLSASAGQSPCDGIADPPPPSAPVADGHVHTGVAGHIPTTVTGQIPTTNSVASLADPVTQMALILFQSVLSLL